MHTRSIVLALPLPLLLAAIAQAQATKTFYGCYVPAIGSMYLIKATGLPTACISGSHVEITWTEGVVADGEATTAKLANSAVTTVKIADGAVTAAKLSADVANALVGDGSITLAKLAFDVATQAELDALTTAVGTAGSLNAPTNPLEWTKLKNVPAFSLANHTHALSGAQNTGVGVAVLAGNTGGFNTAFGSSALESNTSANSNTGIGATALRFNTTGFANTGVGNAALRDNVIGVGNTAVGSGALLSNITDGNTAVGADALQANTTGTFHVAVGHGALFSNTTGGGNTAVGRDALRFNTIGSSNTALGATALRDNTSGFQNIAVGDGALRVHTTGEYNTSVGSFSMFAHTTGIANTALGQAALNVLTTGNDNTALGRNAGAALTSGSNNLYVAHIGVSSEDNTTRIGTGQTRAFLAGVRNVTTEAADAVPVVIDGSGQLGTISSSRRFKQDIADMSDASARLMRLRPVTFRYRQYGDDSALQYGLVAEEVAEVFPDLVVRGKNGEVETVRYQVLSVLLLNEMQRQERELAELKRAVAALQGRR